MRGRAAISVVSLAGAIACAEPTAPSRVPVEVARVPAAGVESAPEKPEQADWEPNERFRVRIEQNGRGVPVVDHRAKLARGPFDIVMRLRIDEGHETFSIALHASTVSAEASRLATGAPLQDADFWDGTCVAEDWRDKDHTLFAREGHHEIVWQSESEHRCAKARRLSPDTLECTRTVERLIGPGGVETSAREMNDLLLVFAKLDHRGARAIEKQRDWMVLRFE